MAQCAGENRTSSFQPRLATLRIGAVAVGFHSPAPPCFGWRRCGARMISQRRRRFNKEAPPWLKSKSSVSDAARSAISQAIHESVMEAFAYPAEKKFHRFIALEEPDFIYPADRSDRYTIIEISIFEGRSVAAKKQLIRLIYERIAQRAGIVPQDIELTLFETPRHAWGIRGKPGDEIGLNYTVEVLAGSECVAILCASSPKSRHNRRDDACRKRHRICGGNDGQERRAGDRVSAPDQPPIRAPVLRRHRRRGRRRLERRPGVQRRTRDRG